MVLSAVLFIHIDNPSTKDRGCIFSGYPHHSLVRSYVSPLSIERDWHTDGLCSPVRADRHELGRDQHLRSPR
jgi:hypothetical protein